MSDERQSSTFSLPGEAFSADREHAFYMMLNRLTQCCFGLLESMPGQVNTIFERVCQEVAKVMQGYAHLVIHRVKTAPCSSQCLSALPSLPIVFGENQYGYLVLGIDTRQPGQPLFSPKEAEMLATFCGLFLHTAEMHAYLYARVPSLAGRKVILTEREREVLILICHGYGNEAIAKRLTISRRTASTHQQRIYKKLGVRSAQDACLAAFLKGFYSPLLDELAIQCDREEEEQL